MNTMKKFNADERGKIKTAHLRLMGIAMEWSKEDIAKHFPAHYGLEVAGVHLDMRDDDPEVIHELVLLGHPIFRVILADGDCAYALTQKDIYAEAYAHMHQSMNPGLAAN